MPRRGRARRVLLTVLVSAAALVVTAALVWQGVTQHGNPDPVNPHLTLAAAVLDTGILVFREGLEAVLVLAAVFASLRGREALWARPVCWGVGAALAATFGTWGAFGAILAAVDAPTPDVEAATGVLAVVVLLVVMNWIFHRTYWTAWIQRHTRAPRTLLAASDSPSALAWRGLAVVGFSATYREGFEVVVFLQNTRLQVGHDASLVGAGIGIGLTLITAALTFVARRRLPYRHMLIATGVMLGGALVVTVGGTILQMQQAGWIGTRAVSVPVPVWAETWLSVYPNAEGLAAQAAAVMLVVGSYWLVEVIHVTRRPTFLRRNGSDAALLPRAASVGFLSRRSSA